MPEAQRSSRTETHGNETQEYVYPVTLFPKVLYITR